MLINFYSLIEGIPQLYKTFGRTGQTGQDSWPNWTNWTRLLAELGKLKPLAQRQRVCKE